MPLIAALEQSTTEYRYARIRPTKRASDPKHTSMTVQYENKQSMRLCHTIFLRTNDFMHTSNAMAKPARKRRATISVTHIKA